MKRRGFVNLLLVIGITAITAAATVGGVWLLGRERGYFSQGGGQYMPRSIVIKTHQSKSGAVEFQYPSRLAVSEEKGKIFIRHSAHFNHVDPCDLKDGTRKLSTIDDFFVSVELVAVKEASELSSVFAAAGRSNAEDVVFGNLEGFRVYSGSHGCGHTVYYFPAPPDKVLVVENWPAAEFERAATADVQKYRELPAVILPEEREKILHAILSSLKLK